MRAGPFPGGTVLACPPTLVPYLLMDKMKIKSGPSLGSGPGKFLTTRGEKHSYTGATHNVKLIYTRYFPGKQSKLNTCII